MGVINIILRDLINIMDSNHDFIELYPTSTFPCPHSRTCIYNGRPTYCPTEYLNSNVFRISVYEYEVLEVFIDL